MTSFTVNAHRAVTSAIQGRSRVRSFMVALLMVVGFSVAAAAPASAATTLWPYEGAHGTAYIKHVDNSGWSRSLTISEELCKEWTILGRLIEYKMDFGPNVTTDWKGGISRGWNGGCTYGDSTDTFYFPNVARGVYVRICVDVPGPFNRCGRSIWLRA
jgi:hypothetical protein